ncbi:MAG TPA: phosphatase domain-containing protein [Burkholderiales bacterium]|nr:phosphatase domain-containing protein [Burkholderiales bacterium]
MSVTLRALLARRRDPVVIVPYLSYGTAKQALVCGRVLEDEGFTSKEGRSHNLANFIKRLESDEVPHARIRVRGRTFTADKEGYFRMALRGRFAAGWNDIDLVLAADRDVRATARVLVPSPKAAFGVISDIDDTVVYSHVARRLRMLATVALSSARQRKPFAGVAAFYRALYRQRNPFFYVSKSPWNLYVPLLEFLELQGLPEGPLLLRDFGWRMAKDHKQKAIAAILDFYPKLPFVLIGDSGEKDPEIYAGILRGYPDRIRAIYIRSVNEKRVAAVKTLAAAVAKTRCPLVLAPNTEIAAVHAAAEGLIAMDDLKAVRDDRKADARGKAR